jgi:hypothetical protein
MSDSEDESQDFSNALLGAADAEGDVFSFNNPNSTANKKQKKETSASVEAKQGRTSIDDLDLLSNDAPTKTRLNGSSFKTMGEEDHIRANDKVSVLRSSKP